MEEEVSAAAREVLVVTLLDAEDEIEELMSHENLVKLSDEVRGKRKDQEVDIEANGGVDCRSSSFSVARRNKQNVVKLMGSSSSSGEMEDRSKKRQLLRRRMRSEEEEEVKEQVTLTDRETLIVSYEEDWESLVVSDDEDEIEELVQSPENLSNTSVEIIETVEPVAEDVILQASCMDGEERVRAWLQAHRPNVICR